MNLASLLAHAGHDHSASDAMLVHALTALLGAGIIAATFFVTRNRAARVAVASAVVLGGVAVVVFA